MKRKTETEPETVSITSKQVIQYEGLTILCQEPMHQGDLVVTLQNVIVALVNAQLGEVAAKAKAVEQGEAAAVSLNGDLKQAARDLGVPDRRRAPLVKVTWCRKNSRINKLTCGHEFRVPSGQVRVAKKRRCVECLAVKVRA